MFLISYNIFGALDIKYSIRATFASNIFHLFIILISPKTENGASSGTTNATINQQLNQQQQLLCSYELQYSEPITQWAVPHLPAMHSITWSDARSAVKLNHKGWLCSLQSKRIWAAVGYSLLRWSHTKRDWRILVLTLIIGQWQLVRILENRFLVLASTVRQYKMVRILDKINTFWMWIKSL